jgi:hypothetical protein
MHGELNFPQQVNGFLSHQRTTARVARLPRNTINKRPADAGLEETE